MQHDIDVYTFSSCGSIVAVAIVEPANAKEVQWKPNATYPKELKCLAIRDHVILESFAHMEGFPDYSYNLRWLHFRKDDGQLYTPCLWGWDRIVDRNQQSRCIRR